MFLARIVFKRVQTLVLQLPFTLLSGSYIDVENSFKCYAGFFHFYTGKEAAPVMRKLKSDNSSNSPRRIRPALTPEARENQLVSLAVDLAEKQLLDGSASSQVITHYLKLGSSKERLEKEILEQQKELIGAKTQSLKSQQKSEELYTKALNAMRIYSGHADSDDY